MDVKLPPKKWYVKYRIHIVAGILAAGLIGMLIKVSTGPKIIRINSDSVQTATVQSGEFSEYVNAEGTLQPIQTIKVYTREGGGYNAMYAIKNLQKMSWNGDTPASRIDFEITNVVPQIIETISAGMYFRNL